MTTSTGRLRISGIIVGIFVAIILMGSIGYLVLRRGSSLIPTTPEGICKENGVDLNPATTQLAVSEYLSPVFWVSPDGRRSALAQRIIEQNPNYRDDDEENNEELYIEKWTVTIDGNRSERYDTISGPIFSSNSKGFAYGARAGNKIYVIVDNVKIEAYDHQEGHPVLIPQPVFNCDSTRIAYRIQMGTREFVVVDGRRSAPYEAIVYDTTGSLKNSIVFSPDGKNVAYRAKLNGKEFVVLGDRKGAPYDVVDAITFSPDGQRLAYIAKQDNKWFVVLDDKLGKRYTKVNYPTFSPDSRKIAYLAIQSDGGPARWFIIVDGQEGKSYADIFPFRGSPIVFSSDGRRLAYVAHEYGLRKYTLVVDGVEVSSEDEIQYPIFGQDGNTIAYIVGRYTNGQEKEIFLVERNLSTLAVVRQGKRYLANINNGLIASPIFDPDGESIAYIARSAERVTINQEGKTVDVISSGGSEFVVLNRKDGQETEGKKYHWINRDSLTFYPKGKRIGYAARSGTEVWWVVDALK